MTQTDMKHQDRAAKKLVKLQLDEQNRQMNEYYEEYQGCKKAWKKGAIFGALAGLLLSFLISGFQLNYVFLAMAPFSAIGGMWTLATVFGLIYTSDFGLSCIPNAMISAVGSIWDIFAGTFITMALALALCGIMLFVWLIAFMFFAIMFPLETLYYRLRFKIQEKSILKRMKNQQ